MRSVQMKEQTNAVDGQLEKTMPIDDEGIKIL